MLARASPVVPVVKTLLAGAEDMRHPRSIPGWEDLQQKGMATHSSTLAWRIPWTEEAGELLSIALQRAKRLRRHAPL